MSNKSYPKGYPMRVYGGHLDHAILIKENRILKNRLSSIAVSVDQIILVVGEQNLATVENNLDQILGDIKKKCDLDDI
jgi:hypothetical protein